MKKLLLMLTVLCGTVSAWAGVTPTEQLKASTILPSMGIPENQYYVLQTKDGGAYWSSATVDTDKNGAGKFAFYAVPGLEDCYYIYSITAGKWITYNKTNRDNQKSFVQSADNFDANAYWKITSATKQNGGACYQMQPTVYTTNQAGVLGIQTDRYANWFQGPNGSATLGLWQQAPSDDEGSAWSVIPVDVTEQFDVILSQRIAVANEILSSQVVYTKGSDILNAENVTSIISSPFTSTQEGSIAKLVDGNAGSSNHWHSDYSGGVKINGSHYIVANLGESTPSLLSFDYARRNNVANDHTTRWAVYGVPSDETNITENSRDGLTLLAIISTPYTSHSESFENLPHFKTQGFKKFRIYSEATNQNRGYFHIGEFQLNANTIADSNADKVKELAAAVAEAEALETVTQADIDKLNAKISMFVLSDEDKARAQELLNLTGVGYPTTNSAARIALQNVLDNPASSITDLEPAIAAYKTSTDVALPVSGKAYQFAFVANTAEKTEYKLVSNGTSLSTSTDATASIFYCVEYTNVNGDKRFAFISEDGKFLGYHALTDSYITHVGADKRLQNDISFSAMTGVASSNVTSTPEDRFGTVTMRVENRVLESLNRDGYFILKWGTNSFDKSSAPYHNGTYTSAIKVTEVAEYTASNAVLTAASTITPLVMGYNRIGEGIGKYSYNYNEGNGTDFNAFETAIKSATDVVESSDYSFAINIPVAGFYYIKSMNANDAAKKNKYWQVNETGTNMELVAEKDVKRSVIYVGADYKLVSFGCGSYLNHYDNVSTAGAAGNAWGIVENAQVVSAYALDHPTEDWFLSDWTGGATYGYNDVNAAWTFEPVATLPVTITSAGYATFFAPVAVEIPEGVEAYYTEEVGENAVVLTAIETGVIPANTGVILKGEANTYNFNITADVEAVAGNKLAGTCASTYVSEDAYVLSKVDGVVGMYKASKNQQGNTSWLNNGFKAYLPATAGGEARFLVFNFGTETGIDELKGENGNVKAEIYDLSGRRVQNAQKGLYIVNGKKVVR